MAAPMKAIVISGPGRADLRDVAPDPLGPGDVRIRLLATGICGTDVEIFDGTMPYFTGGMASYPVIPGHEWVGEVVEAGAAVTAFRPGDRVVGECSVGCMACATCLAGDYHRCAHRTETGILNRNGGFAEEMTFPSLFLHHISPSVPVECAAMVEPAAVAFNGVRRAEVSPRDEVVVFGDGPIGLLVAMMASAFGAARITVVGGMPHRLALARTLGADAVVEYQRDPRRRRGAPRRRPASRLASPSRRRAIRPRSRAPSPRSRPGAASCSSASSPDSARRRSTSTGW